MTILQDMDARFVEARPVPKGATWLIGGNVWHAFLADLTHMQRENGAPDFDPTRLPETVFGLPFRKVHRMTGWGLAERLDAAEAEAQTQPQLELTPHDIAS